MAAGYFKIKMTPETVGKKGLKVLCKLFGWDEPPFEQITLSLKMKRKPTTEEIEVMSEHMKSAGIDTKEVNAQWIKL